MFVSWHTVFVLLEAQCVIEARPHFKQLCALDKIIETALQLNMLHFVWTCFNKSYNIENL